MSILDKFSMRGKVAVVTGGNRSIGRAIAIGLQRLEPRLPSRRVTIRKANRHWRNFADSGSRLSPYPQMSRTGAISRTWLLR